MRRSHAVLATVLSLSLLAACGGDDEAADEGPDRLSKADFISQGDKVCADFQTKGEELTPPADEAGLGEFIREAVALGKEARDEFAALEAPEDGEAVQKSLLDALDTSITTIEEAATAADDGDTEGAVTLIDQATEESEAADEEAQSYGFKECGKSEDDAAAGEDTGGAAADPAYVAEADAACQQFVDGVETIADPADEADLARYISEVQVPLDATLTSLEAVTPPAEAAEVHDALLASFTEYGASVEGARQAAQAGDVVTAGDLLEQSAVGLSSDPLVQGYGFQVCGGQ